jgi:hypothetical protein
MGLKRLFRKSKEPQSETPIDDGHERVPVEIAAKCLGEACAFYAGVECDSRLDLLTCDGDSGAKDLPPYADDPSLTYTMRGRVCTAEGNERLVGVETEVLQTGVNGLMLIALGGRYGDLPHRISTPKGGSQTVETIASSDS